MARSIRLALLGGFDVEVDGRPVPAHAWRRNRARTLVKLLAVAPRHQLHREQLMDALWPELDPFAAGVNLRKAVHFARAALAADLLVGRGELIALTAEDLWTDVAAFELAARGGDVATALALYRGELLPEDRFEPWTDDLRERLRARYHALLLDDAGAREQSGDPDGAVDALERLLASDPLHEEALLALLRLQALAGARPLALTRYAQFEERLRTELGVEPGPALRQLHDDLVAGRFGGTGGPATTATPDHGVSAPETLRAEERRLVTVLSAAAIASADDPELARRELERWSRFARDVVEAWGGATESPSSGVLAAFFGAIRIHEDDVSRALRAAIEIRDRGVLPATIGVATGEAIVALGKASPGRAVGGRIPSLASALQSAARPGTVLVAERAASMAGGGLLFSDPIAVTPGGKAVAVLLRGEATPAAPAVEPPMVGRDVELRAIVDLFADAVARGEPRLVVVEGSAGMGKSRLAREVVTSIGRSLPTPLVLRGRCQSVGRGPVYGALGEVVREACGIAISDTAVEAQARLRDRVGRLVGGPPDEAEPTVMALATTAGIGVPGNPLDSLPPAEVANQLGLAWPAFVSAAATVQPTLLVVEDLHWAGAELLDMLEHIVNRATGPVLALVTARPEFREVRPQFGAPVQVASINLQPLTEADSDRLLANIDGDRDLDDRLRAAVRIRAEGNPFFLEQLSHHVAGSGGTALPDTLQSLLAARLDGLPATERRVLQEASVIGRAFWEAPLRRALSDERVPARLAALERKGFIVRRTTSSLPGQAEYSIRHALLQDAAYASLPRSRRARAHAEAAVWLEEVVGDRAEEHAESLAHHFAASVEPVAAELAWTDPGAREAARSKAHRYLVQAGNAARRRFLTDRAAALHERALAIAVGPAERCAALEALAEDHAEEFHGDRAEELYRAALAIARRSSALRATRARLCRKLAWMMAWNPGGFRQSPDAAAAEALVDEGLRATEDPGERAWLELVRGACARLYRGSEPFGQGWKVDPRPISERIAAAESALATAREIGLDELAGWAGQALGMLYGLDQRYADVLALARREVDQLGPNRSRLEHSDAVRKLAVHVVNIAADFEEGLALGQQCRRLLDASGARNPHHRMHTLWPVLAALFHLGRWTDLLDPLAEHLEAFRSEPAVECQFVRDGPAIGAAALSLLGRAGEAAEVAALLTDPMLDVDSASAWQARQATLSGKPAVAVAISHDKAFHGRTYGPQHAFALLEAYLELGDLDAAAAALASARIAAAGNALLVPMIDRVEGVRHLSAGDDEAGSDCLRRAIDGFRAHRTPFEESRARRDLDRLASALARQHDAG